MQTHLGEKSCLNTYHAVLQQRLVHGVPWRELRSMLKALAEVVQEPRGVLRITRNGQTLVLRQPYNSELAGEQALTEIRRFLQEADRTTTNRQSQDGVRVSRLQGITAQLEHNHEEAEASVPFTAYVACGR